jgi:hypothetical protein
MFKVIYALKCLDSVDTKANNVIINKSTTPKNTCTASMWVPIISNVHNANITAVTNNNTVEFFMCYMF